MEFLAEHMRALVPISQEEFEQLSSYFKIRNYKRNTLLLQAGEVAHELFFVQKGILRQYFHDERGVERTATFALEGQWMTDLESFSRQNGSSSNISCMETSTCLVIRCVDIGKCMREMPAVATFFNTLVEQIARNNMQRIQALLSQSPEQQFQDMLQQRPQLLQRVSQRYIAQYLGIAPESLSRIRKRMLETEKS